MAHNNKTPASILTAPLRQVKAVVSHVPQKQEVPGPDGAPIMVPTSNLSQVHSGPGKVDKLTGVYTNPERAARKAKAAAKRAAGHNRKHTNKGKHADKDVVRRNG